MDWLKIFRRSLILSILVMILFPILQIAIKYVGVVWLAPIPLSATGISFWGAPWGLVSRASQPEDAPYIIEWTYLIYDLFFWFTAFFAYYSIRFRRG